MKRIFAWGLMAALLAPAFAGVSVAQAQTLPDSLIYGVAQISAYFEEPFVPENHIQQGSGTFVSYDGCLMTNSHVVLDLFEEGHPVHNHLVVELPPSRAFAPEVAYEVEVVHVDERVDLALVCPIEDTGEFSHYFERATQPAFETRPFNDEVIMLGYPVSGERSITISTGNIVGFIDTPNIDEWFGIPDLNNEMLTLYKADPLSGPGVSGGAMLDMNYQLVGVPFAGSITPGAFDFVLSEDVFIPFEQEAMATLAEQRGYPSDCVYDGDTALYRQGGVEYYDPMCEYTNDPLFETEISNSYKFLCGEEMALDRLSAAITRSKQLGSLSHWSDYLLKICPVGSIDLDESVEESQPEPVEITEPIQVPLDETTLTGFAYGKARLSSLAAEQAKAIELKAKIDSEFPRLEIDADDWSTVVNSYIYGGYPVEAISRAIELGGYTVHPSIPHASWSKTVEYTKNI